MATARKVPTLPAELLINIFNNLKGKKLIEMTSVCASWNKIIGNSQMDKICLKSNDNTVYTLFNLKRILEYTEREYRNIRIYSVKAVNLEEFETYGFKWKSVKILHSTINSYQSLKDFVMKFVTTLEELDMEHLTFPSRFDIIPIELPNLKSLRCGHFRFEADVLKMLQWNIGRLKEFAVTYRSFSDDNYHIMNHTTELQVLRVSGTPTIDSSMTNLNNFLILKKDYLRELQVDSMSKLTLQLVWNDLKCSSIITFGNHDLLIDSSNFNLNRNTYIRKIFMSRLMQYSLLDKMIHASPNLKHISTPSFRDDIIHLVAEKLNKLQDLYSYKTENGNPRRVVTFKVYETTIDIISE